MTRRVPDILSRFQPPVRDWFRASFAAPTAAQQLGWAAISGGESTLILAPTGSGKTLAAFLWCLNRLMFAPQPPREKRCRLLYISPLKALAVDVERNLRAPIAGISHVRAAGFLRSAQGYHLGGDIAGFRQPRAGSRRAGARGAAASSASAPGDPHGPFS